MLQICAHYFSATRACETFIFTEPILYRICSAKKKSNSKIFNFSVKFKDVFVENYFENRAFSLKISKKVMGLVKKYLKNMKK